MRQKIKNKEKDEDDGTARGEKCNKIKAKTSKYADDTIR